MTMPISKSPLQARIPRLGMVIEPVITYEEVPVVTDAARNSLFASLEKNAEDTRRGLGAALTADELKSELRSSFEAVTGFKAG